MRIVPVLAMLVLATPALAQSDAGKQEAEKPVEKKICRPMPQTGSIMTKRECHTKAEWEALSNSSTNARDKLNRDYGGRPGGTGISTPNTGG